MSYGDTSLFCFYTSACVPLNNAARGIYGVATTTHRIWLIFAYCISYYYWHGILGFCSCAFQRSHNTICVSLGCLLCNVLCLVFEFWLVHFCVVITTEFFFGLSELLELVLYYDLSFSKFFFSSQLVLLKGAACFSGNPGNPRWAPRLYTDPFDMGLQPPCISESLQEFRRRVITRHKNSEHDENLLMDAQQTWYYCE